MNRRSLIKGIVGLGLLLSLNGCATVVTRTNSFNTPSHNFIQYKDVGRIIFSSGINAFNQVILDDEYVLPSFEWINHVLYPEFLKRQKNNNLWKYKLQSNDCDKDSGRFRLLAHELNNLTSNSGQRGIAIGEFIYNNTPNTKHDINFIILKTGEKYEVLFFEPQTGEFVFLTDEQKSMGYAWII